VKFKTYLIIGFLAAINHDYNNIQKTLKRRNKQNETKCTNHNPQTSPGGDSHVKRTSLGGLPWRHFETNPYEVPKPCGHSLKCFYPLKDVHVLKHHINRHWFFWLKYPERYCKSSWRGTFCRLNTKSFFLIPKRCNMHPCPFYRGILPPSSP